MLFKICIIKINKRKEGTSSCLNMMMKKIISWYSNLYPYAIGLLMLESTANVYCLSIGNIPSDIGTALILWVLLSIIGLTSFLCKKLNPEKDSDVQA